MTTEPTPAPAPKKPASPIGCLAVVALLAVALYLTGGRTGAPSSTAPAAGATARPASAVLLELTGNGIKKSKPFTATGPWSLGYDFDCASFGMTGNFIVTVYSTAGDLVDVAVNELALRGHDTTQGYAAGSLYLEMNSECSWAVRVTG